MSVFFRFIRPVKFNQKRIELLTSANGGICLRCEPLGETMLVTYSRCHTDNVFNKDIAKIIANERADYLKSNDWGVGQSSQLPLWQVPVTQNTELIIILLQQKKTFSYNEKQNISPFELYYTLEWKKFISALSKLVYSNQKEQEKLEVWKSALAHSKLKTEYEKVSRGSK